jgi:hypothetical protein
MPLKYVADAFALLDHRPKVDAAARTRMKAQATKYGFTFPAAVAEWFAHGGKGWLGQLLARGRDNLKELAWTRLGAPLKVDSGTRRYDPIADGMLVLIADEDWGFWAVRLEGDDPPVFWCDSIPGPGGFIHRWTPLTERFSDFALGVGWRNWKADRARGGTGCFVCSLMAKVRPRLLALLLAHFEEGPSHCAETFLFPDRPPAWHYLFRREGCYLWMWNTPDKAEDKGESAWFLGADTTASLRETLELLWHLGEFDNDLHWPTVFGPAERVWDETQASPPPFPGPGWDRVFGDDLVPLFASGELLSAERAPALLPPHLDYLIDNLDEVNRQPFAHGLTAYHFHGDDGRLFVISGDHNDRWARSSWWVHADSPEALTRLLRQFGHICDLTQVLGACTAAGQQVLTDLRPAKKQPRKRGST